MHFTSISIATVEYRDQPSQSFEVFTSMLAICCVPEKDININIYQAYVCIYCRVDVLHQLQVFLDFSYPHLLWSSINRLKSIELHRFFACLHTHTHTDYIQCKMQRIGTDAVRHTYVYALCAYSARWRTWVSMRTGAQKKPHIQHSEWFWV